MTLDVRADRAGQSAPAGARHSRPSLRRPTSDLLHVAMAGDQTLFLREDAVERSWEIVPAPVLDASGNRAPLRRGHPWGPSGPGRSTLRN